ncbi:hypothetical protein PFICI_03231 [Pestalotiopsis fici W106-1]|uniref:NmrA-like domain-containing protein n=1 Tax=Pestalotiopsis fici (strain W106-1 / CGMCC3.15140) TaxID=1229662 RepID=W3XJ13_PESFW|nr:uncharacterized protein PFICI_03231 [Pestalotiopsis fici W106-1]ETS85206.1 hypothetical protein PFICI_03231 [Pestalotiopsis fici W106-1]
MVQITKVALAGATGSLGSVMLDELLQAGFEVTVLTRSADQKLPGNVTVKAVDYDSVESVTEALRGQQAVVSTIGGAALGKQLTLVEAAANAGVLRFIPSEFGSNTLNPKVAQLPVFTDKVAVQNALKKQADAGRLTYTLIANGPFLDWGLEHGLIANPKEKSITIFDGGNQVFSATTLSTIGKSVASTLRHLEETKNRPVYIQGAALTSNQVLKLAEKATGTSWKKTEASIDDRLSAAWAELKKEKPNEMIFVLGFIVTSIWGQGYGMPFEKTDNELLGIKETSEDEIIALIQKYA